MVRSGSDAEQVSAENGDAQPATEPPVPPPLSEGVLLTANRAQFAPFHSKVLFFKHIPPTMKRAELDQVCLLPLPRGGLLWCTARI